MKRNRILALTGFIVLFGSQAIIADDTQESESASPQQKKEMTDSNQSSNTEALKPNKLIERAPYMPTIDTEEDKKETERQ